ncbi:MAG: hypothetical protein A2268_11775 [Candidatus Raymondbacteria bacterium RifOxyA12_full_50_37]|uniref:Type II secretion system protein GspI C-terminal domain-containing protein n=1 Tax=Candidatus Raymondbacteria bacterium RIFOXYD12_FULL_49_13 TaxID=1817890 RepID=A0A1F7FLA7_UNCRA|nr:MAG: hypothetical protein A2268_11775 [Candidatus Raymondbacteria bacterium RifOxyA12_full_50_37]OGJ98732.1 MAG: hypothetical protein A2453_08270 [Candidatus Raymondbacteria bacterium RIFOXYC2_FULL_50_21]OGK07450.1 MAG: hypothetical protein A2519_11165 [Candidatus Raymondbacteria bacterium RIFOXYD12_FULL_49_13]OGK07817.1 MAG: hypothetical protein A2487_00190 [Candidatus Raymondbacteria bacterium RifOxyC12_full_50_8]OGP43895.1 MAG: hypothetical protein A2324_05225 [Candidatus Raymondbacteria 
MKKRALFLTNRSGFTLTEIMIALALFSVVALPASRYLSRMMVSQTDQQLYYAMQLAQAEMEQYLASRGNEPENKTVMFNGLSWEIQIQSTGNGYRIITLSINKKGVKVLDIVTGKYAP